jgi:hypothetical protein
VDLNRTILDLRAELNMTLARRHHPAVELRSRLPAPDSRASLRLAWAVMLFSASMVNVFICFSPGAVGAVAITSITPVRSEGKADPPDLCRNVSALRKRALESPGRAWR